MHRHLAALLAFGLACGSVPSVARAAAAAAGEAFVGRWDIDIHTPEGDLPSWLEIRRSGTRTLVGQFVGVSGSARPISRVEVEGDVLRFSIPPQWEDGAGDLSFRGKVQDDRLTGSMTFPDNRRFDWSARRAPALQRPGTPRWGEPVRLFNGTDLSGWRALGQSRLASRGRRIAQHGSGRQPGDRTQVHRLQAARRIALAQGQQQRRVPARAPRGADRRPAGRACERYARRRVWIPCADREKRARVRTNGNRSTSRWSGAGSRSWSTARR